MKLQRQPVLLLTVVIVILTTSSLAAAPSASFSGVVGTVLDIVVPSYPAAAVAIKVDSGGDGGRYFICYDQLSSGIQKECSALKPGDRVILNGQIQFGPNETIDFFVTSLYRLAGHRRS